MVDGICMRKMKTNSGLAEDGYRSTKVFSQVIIKPLTETETEQKNIKLIVQRGYNGRIQSIIGILMDPVSAQKFI